MAPYSSLVIVILVVSAAQAHHHSSHNNLPLRERYNDLIIVKEFNFKPYDYEMLKSIYKSDYGFETLRSLINNILDIDQRFKYFEIFVNMFVDERPVDAYKTIELIKDVKVILSDVNLDQETKGKALTILSYLSDKLLITGIDHLREFFESNKRIDESVYDLIVEGIYEFDRELGRMVFYKFVNESYENDERTKLYLITFIGDYGNVDLKVSGLLAYVKASNLIDTNFYAIADLVRNIMKSDGYKDLPLSTKYRLEHMVLPKIPPCIRALVLSGNVTIKNAKTQSFLAKSKHQSNNSLYKVVGHNSIDLRAKWKWDVSNEGVAFCKQIGGHNCIQPISDSTNASLVVKNKFYRWIIKTDGEYCSIVTSNRRYKLASLEGTHEPEGDYQDNPIISIVDKDSKEYNNDCSKWQILPSI